MQKDDKTPWRTGRENRGMGHYSYAVLEGDRLVAKGEHEDVERIVRAVNAYDALIAERDALRDRLMECVRQMKNAAPLLEMFPDNYGKAINKADQLLAPSTYEVKL